MTETAPLQAETTTTTAPRRRLTAPVAAVICTVLVVLAAVGIFIALHLHYVAPVCYPASDIPNATTTGGTLHTDAYCMRSGWMWS